MIHLTSKEAISYFGKSLGGIARHAYSVVRNSDLFQDNFTEFVFHIGLQLTLRTVSPSFFRYLSDGCTCVLCNDVVCNYDYGKRRNRPSAPPGAYQGSDNHESFDDNP